MFCREAVLHSTITQYFLIICSDMNCPWYVRAVLMDLSKSFHCISHYMILAKLLAYGLSLSDLESLLLYLSDRHQCVNINKILSNFMEMISGISQSSVFEPVLFNPLIIDLETVSIHWKSLKKFPSIAWVQSISDLIAILEPESHFARDWFTRNKIVVNPEKFQANVLDQKKSDHRNKSLTINNQQ